MKSQLFLLGCCLMLLFAACGPKVVYQEKQTFEAGSWAFQDSTTFTVNVTDTLKTYDLLVELDHGTDYAYHNCYLYVSTVLPTGQWLGKRINVDMADKTGKWYGDCTSQKCKLVINLQSNAFFNQLGDHQFIIKQFMRDDPLAEVRAIGFKVIETGLSR
ncbi:MAG: gliding motility lipoprotein GldH [Bacteroidota bacterium]